MDLTERLLKTLRDIDRRMSQIDLKAAEQLYAMRLVDAPNGTNYQLTSKGLQILAKNIVPKD